MLLHRKIHRPWLVSQVLEKTKHFCCVHRAELLFWGRERVEGIWANKMLKIKLTERTQA